MKHMLNDHLFKTRKLQSDNKLFLPENFSGLSRNGPLTRKTSYQYQVSFKVHLALKHFFVKMNFCTCSERIAAIFSSL